ncbi:hypothetical protein BDV93DRAFT_562062 [Ceratobasidium sp. AG-I]|nr:hypothetical protein BDV93DRAFT_562062 [Ceratobasidium sp. AG-I]
MQLVAALETGSLHPSESGSAGERIPIKCVYLDFLNGDPIRWSTVDQLLSDFPSTIENFLCFNVHSDGSYSACAIQRSSNRQIRRKEFWQSPASSEMMKYWILLQTSHIIQYDPSEIRCFKFARVELLSTVTYFNCTKRRRGRPYNDAIPTGGRLIRVANVEWNLTYNGPKKLLVWSCQNFAEGEYDDVCSTPLVGPMCS